MGEALDRHGNILGRAEGDTAKEVFDKLTKQHIDAAELRIRLAEQRRGSGVMTVVQEAHLASIKAAFAEEVDRKYRRGQEEHGGNLFDKSELALAQDMVDEAVDQLTYAITLRDKLREKEKGE